jgi:hypothetical protein
VLAIEFIGNFLVAVVALEFVGFMEEVVEGVDIKHNIAEVALYHCYLIPG